MSHHASTLRQNKQLIAFMQKGNLPDFEKEGVLVGCPQDLLFQLVLIGLNSEHTTQVVDAIKMLGCGNLQFERVHLELIYQYVRQSKDTLSKALSILTAMLEHQPIPQAYFYFNGFLSGIYLNSKLVQPWPFIKGFAACVWFNISGAQLEIQDNNNLPVLFNCYSKDQGGFECYFNKQKLFYRILPPNYSPPTTESNGLLVSEFTPGKWNYLAIEHDKPFVSRAQLVAVVNDKQVVSFSMDYPQFDRNPKLSQVSICNNFVGQMSNFVLFKESVNSPQKFVEIYKRQKPDFKQFDTQVAFDSHIQKKVFLCYSPWRTYQKIIHDCIDQNDGELLISSGVYGTQQLNKRQLLEAEGGLESLLALLDRCKTSEQVNQFLKIVIAVINGKSEKQNTEFFELLFTFLQSVPSTAVNCQTVHLLTEMRITIQDRSQNEAFFKALVMSADFWLNTENIEVLQEYWSFVKSIYSQNPVQHNQVVPISNLISLMVKISDTHQSYCCTYHKRTNELFYNQVNETQPNSSHLQVYQYLEPIAGVLECVLTSGGDEILAQIDFITRSLTLKSSPCFQIQILKLLKVLLLDTKQSQHECASPIEFAQRFLNAHGLNILLYLCGNNASLDVKAMCIKLIDVLSSHSSLIQMRIDTDLITYLSHVLLPQHMTVNLKPQQRRRTDSFQEKFQLEEQQSAQKDQFFFQYQEAVNDDTQERDEEQKSNNTSGEEEDFQFLKSAEKFSKTQNNFSKPLICDDDNDRKESTPREEEAEEEEEEELILAPPVPKTKRHQPNQGFKFGGLALESSESQESPQQNSQPSQEKSNQSSPKESKDEECLSPQLNEQANNEEELRDQVEEILSTPQSTFQQKKKDQKHLVSSAPNLLKKPRGLATLAIPDEDSESEDQGFKLPPTRSEHQNRFGERILGDFGSDDENEKAQQQSRKDEEAPKPTVDVLMSRNLRSGAGKGFNFGGLQLGDSSSENESQEEQKSAAEPSQEEVKEPTPKRPQQKLVGNKYYSSGLQSGLKLSLSNKDNNAKEDEPIMKAPPRKGNRLQLQIEPDIQNNRLAGTTGATDDVEDQQPPPTRSAKKPFSLKPAGLKLDTDKINDMFTFGGERGDMRAEHAQEKLEEDIQELALICVQAMRNYRKQKKQDEDEFSLLLKRPEKALQQEHQNLLNSNQSVKGIRNIGERLQQPLSLLPDVEEEEETLQMPSESTLPLLNTLQTGQTIQEQGRFRAHSLSETLKSQDEYTNELENLYTSCLEWILNRAPSQLFKTMMVDDYDKIQFLPAMQVLMILVSHANNLVRQRALQDMFMLAQWDSQNGSLLLQHKSFHSWLLELLTPYQQEIKKADQCKAVYDMGCKLHTLLLKNSCVCPEEEEGFKKLNLLARWPIVGSEKGFDKHGALELSRSLIISLANTLTNIPSAVKNLTHLTLQVHELILCSSDNPIKSQKPDQGHNESLFQWVLKSFLCYQGSVESNEQQQWADKQLATVIIQSWDTFFLGSNGKKEEEGEELDKTIRALLFAKKQADINQTVNLIMQVDMNGPLTPQNESKGQSYQQRLLSLGGFNQKKDLRHQSPKLKIFTLQALVNISCLALTLAIQQGDKQQLKQWLSKIELLFKYTMLLSELWQPTQDEQFYQQSQKKIAETCAFILAFMFQEIHTSQTPKGSQSTDSLQKSKIFQSCLKSCLIFMINTVGMQQEHQPGIKDKAITIILEKILVKQYSTQTKPLISTQDIHRLIESQFEEFPECFQQNDWKLAFFHNSLISQAIQTQLNNEIIEVFKQKRLLYALRLRETESSTAQANDEILKKIQVDTLQAVSDVTHLEHDAHNIQVLQLHLYQKKSSLMQENWLKKVTSARGLWHSTSANFNKLSSQHLGEGQKCLFKPVQSNEFCLVKDKSIEPQIFNHVVRQEQLIKTGTEFSFKYFSKQLQQNQLNDLKFISKSIIVDNFMASLNPPRKIAMECEGVSILTALAKRTGTLLMTNFEVLFVYDLVPDAQNSTIFFFQWEPKSKLTKTVTLSSIREVQKRRFLGQNKALELFLMSNKTLLLDFKDAEQRDNFSQRLIRQRQNKCQNLQYFQSLNHKNILKKSNLVDDWQNHRISNLKYLMSLNQLASRSYHDLSQYHVFPWVLSHLQKTGEIPDLQEVTVRGGAPPLPFRDLNKNMQLLGSAERQAEFKRKYEDLEGFDGMDDRFHCGSHYSNPGIVLHYLVRLQEMVEANVTLQSGAMDHPDRVFQDIKQSYYHSLNDFADVRELIPEFYCMPEFLQNQNLINFGIKEGDQSKVDNVILPEWAQKQTYKFISTMRQALESPYVSQNLDLWIDYIFGYKQRDQEAVKCLNTFSKFTYQVDQPGDFDITQIKDAQDQLAYENQGYNFGQTPLQLFKEKHPQRLTIGQALKFNLVVDNDCKLKVFKPVPSPTDPKKSNTQSTLITSEAILFAKFIQDNKIVGVKKEGFAQNFVWLPRAHDQDPKISFSLGSDKKLKFNSKERDKGMDQVDRSIKKFDLPITITKDGSYIVRGGYWDGRVVFSPVEGSSVAPFELSDHKITVCSLACDSNEQTLITGTKTGEVIIWRSALFDSSLESPSSNNPWVNIKRLNDHERQITSIFIAEEMCLFSTSSTDGFINLYNLWTGAHIRSFQHPNSLPIYQAVLSQNPLPMVCFYSKDDHLWHSMTLSGTVLDQDSTESKKVRYEESSHIVQPLIIKSSQHMDKLVYGSERGYIQMRHLPSLERFRKLSASKEYPVLTLLVSPDRRFLLTGCGDGGLIVITDKIDSTQQTQQSTSLQSSMRTQTSTTQRSGNIMNQTMTNLLSGSIMGQQNRGNATNRS